MSTMPTRSYKRVVNHGFHVHAIWGQQEETLCGMHWSEVVEMDLLKVDCPTCSRKLDTILKQKRAAAMVQAADNHVALVTAAMKKMGVVK